jgi:hypothetical protein
VTEVGRTWYGRYAELRCFRCHQAFYV